MSLTTDREIAIRSFINEWLKDTAPYCHNCGNRIIKANQCNCEQPRVASNMQIVKETIEDVELLKKSRANDFASTKDKSLRFALRLPQCLVMDLETYFEEAARKYLPSEEFIAAQQKGEFKLFNKEYTVGWFVKRFPQFCVPERY